MPNFGAPSRNYSILFTPLFTPFLHGATWRHSAYPTHRGPTHAFSVCKRFFTPSFVPYLSIHTHFYSHSHLSGTQNLPVPQRPVATVPPLPSTMLCVAASEQRGNLPTSSRGLCAEAPRGGSPRHVQQRSSLDLAHRRSPDLAHRRSPDKSAVLLAKMTDDRKSSDTIAALPSVAPLLTVRRPQRSMAPSTM